ncbi:MAG TPA: hypothetical protein VFE62_08105 [Gemmataceae bacterium]|nr:hypothetical protein [Gemmataceae bacterium]
MSDFSERIGKIIKDNDKVVPPTPEPQKPTPVPQIPLPVVGGGLWIPMRYIVMIVVLVALGIAVAWSQRTPDKPARYSQMLWIAE